MAALVWPVRARVGALMLEVRSRVPGPRRLVQLIAIAVGILAMAIFVWVIWTESSAKK